MTSEKGVRLDLPVWVWAHARFRRRQGISLRCGFAAPGRIAQRVIRTHLACVAGAAGNESCPHAREMELQEAEDRAAQTVATACTEAGQVQSLRFVDVAEVLKDVGIACRELDGCETCDDGNDEDGDGCSSTCQRSGF